MKKNILIFFLSVFCFACNQNDTSKPTDSNATTTTATATNSNPNFVKGEALIKGSDCLGCHKTNASSVGPAYNLVAKRYEMNETNINLLSDKIVAGGSGVWGAVPMAAHPAISKEDAMVMVKYILLLKDEK